MKKTHIKKKWKQFIISSFAITIMLGQYGGIRIEANEENYTEAIKVTDFDSNLSFSELLERFGDTDEILRQLELHRPAAPTQIRTRALQDFSLLETTVSYDESGYPTESFTPEADAEFWRLIYEDAANRITPEFLEYAEEIGRHADIMLAIEYYKENGHVPINARISDFLPTTRRMAGVLDAHDGVGTVQRGLATSEGSWATNYARFAIRPSWMPDRYTNDQWRDALRHFAWNQNMAGLGSQTARIIGNNHEYSSVLIRRHDGVHMTHHSQLSDAMIISLRDSMVHIASVSGVAAFNSTFTNHEIMDLWNNRAGVIRHGRSSGMPAFRQAWDAGEIIGASHAVTGGHRDAMRLSGWWRH